MADKKRPDVSPPPRTERFGVRNDGKTPLPAADPAYQSKITKSDDTPKERKNER